MEQNFLGRWVLLPEQSQYSQGTPPASALYEFKKGPDGSLDVFIQWTDAAGASFEMMYNTLPNGIKQAYKDPKIADEIRSEFVGPHQLNSYSYKAGQTIATTTRTLHKTGLLEVVQRFNAPDGTAVTLVQFYTKAP